MSKTYRVFTNASNINEGWNRSPIDERKKLLRHIGIVDKDMIKQLVKCEYINLNSEVRFKLECP